MLYLSWVERAMEGRILGYTTTLVEKESEGPDSDGCKSRNKGKDPMENKAQWPST